MVAIIPTLLILLILGGLIYVVARKTDKSGLKFMLLGLSIILFGGIIVVDSNSDLGSFEYLIVFTGLILSVVGFGKKN